MKTQYIILLISSLFAVTAKSQGIKKTGKDTVKAGRANDRLKNAGPVQDWPKKSKPDSKKDIKPAPLTDSTRHKH
ncbi:MAG: hypothetical protein IPM95_05475 [Sphingobacteriales bacterium]|jgi:hypothetical protein|nr:hypothetical protein [Sphingobacteriales bacterium]